MVDGCYVLFVFEKARSCILRQLLTFILLPFIQLQVVLFSSFRADEKEAKGSAQSKEQSNFSLLRNFFEISIGRKVVVI